MEKYYIYRLLRLFHFISKDKYKKKTAKYTREYKTIARSKLFDKKWYLEHNPDVKKTGTDPIQHYLNYGWKEGRNPSKKFDGNMYLKVNSDVTNAKVNPLVHFELHGKKEGRFLIDSQKAKNKIIIKRACKKSKGVIYTCITGGYDNLIQHAYQDQNWDYICFTDSENLLKQGKVGQWIIKPLQFSELDNVRNARWHKTHPHVLFSEYDFSVWIDGNIDVISKSLFYIIKNLLKSEDVIFAYRHPLRNCIYDEADAVKLQKKDTPDVVKKAMLFLESENYPKNNGLCETGVILRKHNILKCKKAMDIWWSLIEKYSKRDQLSFNYALWKTNCKIFGNLQGTATLRDLENFAIVKTETHNSKIIIEHKIEKVSVIIPVYNALEDVKNLLESIEKTDFSETTEFIVVDDCSKKETADYLDEFITNHSSFKLLRNVQNKGFIKSCNRGMKESKGDLVILLNSDTLLPKAFEKKVIYCFNKNKNVGVASPISSDTGLWKIKIPENMTVNDMDIAIEKASKKAFPDILCPEGFCFCIRKEVINQIGYLDEIFGIGYCEETDYVFRAIDNGWRAILIDNLFVYHKHHVSFGSEKRKEQIEKNSKILWERWRGLYERLAVKINTKRLVNDMTDAILRNIKTVETDESGNIIECGHGVTLWKEINGRGNRISVLGTTDSAQLKIKIHGNKNQVIIDEPRMLFGVSILIGTPTTAINNSLIHIKKGWTCSGAMICLYHSNSSIKIGEDCMFSSDITIRLGELPHLLFDEKTGACSNKPGNLSIGNHCWFGEKSTILKNSSIGDNCIVGFGSVVTKNFSTYSNVMIAGNPAKVKKKHVHWERNKTSISKQSKYFTNLPKFK